MGQQLPQAGMCISSGMCVNAPRWSTQLGIPEEDQNAWADSCPNQPGWVLVRHAVHTHARCGHVHASWHMARYSATVAVA